MSAGKKKPESDQIPQTTPPPEGPGPSIPKRPSTAAEILALADSLSPEERIKLARYGGNLPQGVDSSQVEKGAPCNYGYWCSSCNGLSLLFPGTKWGPNGQFDMPLAGMRLDSLAWMQNEPNIGGRQMLCAACGASIPLSASQGLLKTHVRSVEVHASIIDKHFSRELDKTGYRRVTVADGEGRMVTRAVTPEEYTKLKEEGVIESEYSITVEEYAEAQSSNADLGGASHSYDRDQSASDLMSDQAKSDVEHIAAATNIAGAFRGEV